MQFPNLRITPLPPGLSTEDLAGLVRRVRWAYDGTPTVPPGPTHTAIEDLALWMVRAGEARVTWPGGRQIYRPGQWVLPPTPSLLVQEFAPGTRLVSIRLLARWSGGTPLVSLDRPLTFSAVGHPSLLEAAGHLVRIVDSHGPDSATQPRRILPLVELLRVDAAVQSLLATLLPILVDHGVILGYPGRVDTRVEAAMTLLENHPELSPRTVAARLSISISQLDRLFSQALGMTPSAWRQRRRLEFARRRLRQTGDPIKAIAYAARFRRVSHFSAWFAKATGMSPRAYRQAGDALA